MEVTVRLQLQFYLYKKKKDPEIPSRNFRLNWNEVHFFSAPNIPSGILCAKTFQKPLQLFQIGTSRYREAHKAVSKPYASLFASLCVLVRRNSSATSRILLRVEDDDCAAAA
jgi:hypothetical protein